MPELQNERGRQAAAISNAITRLYVQNHGRGSRTTHTIIQRNYVLTVLEDIYTPGERTLLNAGFDEQVKQTRQAFQTAMRSDFTAAVEKATLRKVIAFMSQNHTNPDYAAELFILQPHETDEAAQLTDTPSTA